MAESKIAKINTRAFALAWASMGAITALILSTWMRFTEMATYFWKIYSSFLPSPYPVEMVNPSLLKHTLGVGIDVLYATVDGFIFGFAIALFYNLFSPKK